jgi:hypothetical protein
MSFSLKHFTLRHYIRHVRRQSKHVQHVHAFVFAAFITGSIAALILHTQYGFWRQTYYVEKPATEEQVVFDPESPGRSFADFWQEARTRFGSIGASGSGILEGKEIYKKEE